MDKNEQAKNYYYANREKIKERRKQRYRENKEKELERNRKWKENNSDYMKKWRDEHKEEISIYNKKKYKEYQDTPLGRAKNLVTAYRQRDKKYSRGECTITSQWIVDNIFGKPCEYCRKERNWRKIGCDRKDSSLPHTPENCIPCCLSCNSKKGSMSFEEFKQKMQGN